MLPLTKALKESLAYRLEEGVGELFSVKVRSRQIGNLNEKERFKRTRKTWKALRSFRRKLKYARYKFAFTVLPVTFRNLQLLSF